MQKLARGKSQSGYGKSQDFKGQGCSENILASVLCLKWANGYACRCQFMKDIIFQMSWNGHLIKESY